MDASFLRVEMGPEEDATVLMVLVPPHTVEHDMQSELDIK